MRSSASLHPPAERMADQAPDWLFNQQRLAIKGITMRLQSVKFAEFEGTPQEWKLEGLSLGARNLIVGKNASGKSRALNVINALARNLAGLQPPGLSANYDVVFTQDNKSLRYQLKYEEEQVIEEKFSVGDSVLLNRGIGGEGIIWAEEIDGGKKVRFQTPPGELAAVARRDAIQHKFLEPLYAWASSLRHYCFGTNLGKDLLAVFVEKGGRKPDERDPNAVVALYRQAEKDFKDEFKQAVISDMSQIDYQIEDIGIKVPISIRVISGLPGELVGLYVKEKDLAGITDQYSMSQGMFRALSIIIQVNYSQMAKKATCILIDDIGEGLDFDRSCRLIDLLRKKAKESSVQLILSTNDRFVMNRVPLKEWSMLQRHGSHVWVRNYENSRDVFEEFKYTGLSNFSFLEMDFVNGPPREEAAAHE
jgi:energy-coupling factor transporter ATP-binding protein EcfA2